MMRMKYGDDASLEFADEIGRALRDGSYEASAELAQEKGPFPACDIEKLLQAEFIKTLPEDLRTKIAEFGMRNIQINTVAPTGTISLTVGQNCSSGIEPIFALEYDRRIRTGHDDETRTERVYDYAWLLYQEHAASATDRADGPVKGHNGHAHHHGPNGKKGPNGAKVPGSSAAEVPDYFVSTADVDPKKAIDMQAVFQKYIDHSISKTLNLKPGSTLADYKDLYLYAYSKGLKGFTTFNPEGNMRGVLEATDSENRIVRRFAPRRPKALPADIHSFKGKELDYIILIGKLNGSLYEVFVIDNPEMYLDLKRYKTGKVEKMEGGRYDLIIDTGPVHIRIEDFTHRFNSPNASLARFISMAMRHGTPLQFIVDQLNKDTNFTDCERGIARVLKKYIEDGERVLTSGSSCESCGQDLVYKEGCLTCSHCGWSKCS
jgi:ribonucleoside-diphosphate reductase alpha chain